MQFYYCTCMLQMNNTNDDPEYFFEVIDEEFEILESVIKNALEIMDVYERLVESSNK